MARRLDFTAGIVPFIRDGLEAGEPVMVAVGRLHTEWLREALDGQADVEFVDMEELGRNQHRSFPLGSSSWTGRGGFVRTGCRGPIWPGRRPEGLLSVSCTKPC